MEDDLTLRVNPDQENVKSVFGIEDALDEHSQSNANNEVETTKDIRFRFRHFCAPAEQICMDRHVFRLEVPPSLIQRWLPSWTPQLVRSWLQRMLPEWFLPTSVILKERNPAKADYYENEIDTYLHLRHIQGILIPNFFGEVAVSYPEAQRKYQMSKRPTPAILLEDIEGVSLRELPDDQLGDPGLIEKLRDTYDRLTNEGVVHKDPRLHNFLLVGERIVALDFEDAEPYRDGEITNVDALETLKSEIARRVGKAQGMERASLGSNLVYYGRDVARGLSDLRRPLDTGGVVGAPDR